MTKVTIVSRTRMDGLVCVGGLTRDDFRNVRLLPASGAHGHAASAPYAIGQVWEMDLEPVAQPEAPHVEDVLVLAARGPIAPQMGLGTWLANNTRPWVGSADVLFDGMLRLSPSGRAYIAHGAVPPMSVGFWQPDRDLVLEDNGERYTVPWRRTGQLSVKFVGDASPAPRIETGTLVRVSLSRWFRSPSGTDGCWLQISGAYPVPGPTRPVVPPPPVLADEPWSELAPGVGHAHRRG